MQIKTTTRRTITIDPASIIAGVFIGQLAINVSAWFILMLLLLAIEIPVTFTRTKYITHREN